VVRNEDKCEGKKHNVVLWTRHFLDLKCELWSNNGIHDANWDIIKIGK